MKRFLLLALWTALAIFFGGPMVLGIVDLWCWVVIGHAVTGIEWNANSVPLAVLFLLPAAGCALVAGIIAEEAVPLKPYVPRPPPPKRPGSNPPPTYARPPMPPAPLPPRDLRGERG